MPTERRRVEYAGRVQGVGFRFTAQRLANQFAVAGSVRNLPDGRVELIAEGESAEVVGFLRSVENAMGAKIHSMTVTNEPLADPPDPDFSIRH